MKKKKKVDLDAIISDLLRRAREEEKREYEAEREGLGDKSHNPNEDESLNAEDAENKK